MRYFSRKNLLFLFLSLVVIFFVNKFFTFSLVKESYNYKVPKQMRGFSVTENLLTFKENLEIPTINEDEMLIRVRSYSLESKEGCRDFSGVVVSKGTNVKNFDYQNRVYGRLPLETLKELKKNNTICPEILKLKKNEHNSFTIAKKPLSITHFQAANIPYIADYLIDFLKKDYYQDDQEILITNGISTLGSVLVYYLKSLNVKSIATEEDKNQISKFKMLSFEDFKTTQEFEENIKKYQNKFDMIFYLPGNSIPPADIDIIIKNGGKIINFTDHKFVFKDKNINTVNASKGGIDSEENFEKIGSLINRGKIPVMIDKIYSIEQLNEALEFKQKHPNDSSVNLVIAK